MTGLVADGEMGVMLPGTPPPDFDLELAVASLRRMRDLGAARLLFSHYGPITKVSDSLERAEEEIRVWVDAVRDARRDGAGRGAEFDLDHAVAMVRERVKDRYARLADRPEQAARFEGLSSAEANVTGIARWLEGQGE